MIVYHGTERIRDDAGYAEFMELFGAAVLEQSELPFLLVRDDGVRLLIVRHEGMILLAVACTCFDYAVSRGSTYVEASVRFRGIHGECEAQVSNFVDAAIAVNGIEAFFSKKRIADEVDFTHGLPDKAILSFPNSIRAPRQIRREHTVKRVTVTEELRRNMMAVCEFLDSQSDDPDFFLGDDAIQMGSLCGGQMDESNDVFMFSYYDSTGEVWSFEIPRTIMDGIQLLETETPQRSWASFIDRRRLIPGRPGGLIGSGIWQPGERT